jgi:hypothetical protein
LLLSEGHRLRDLEISLTILPGELDAKNREKLPEPAIGGIWWLPDQVFIHGWFYLKASDYAAVWNQVTNGGYETSGITLGLTPVEFTNSSQFAWTGNPVSIDSADVYFTRETKTMAKNTVKKEVRSTASKQWAVILFVMAALAWFFPQWNGIFFEPSRDMTTGEGRIVAAVLFVGGLLLWFLGSLTSARSTSKT